jgi:glycerol kinase
MKAILAIDQGTTGSTALLINQAGQATHRAYAEITQHYPHPGWVEHDANEIWRVSQATMADALRQADLAAGELAAIGITNQRETTVVWDRHTGQPVHPAIVWQSRQSAAICERLKADGHEALFRARTGLRLDAYFSASKIRWILDQDPALQARADAGELLFGTIDSWLLWQLTGAAVHATDPTNASRSLLFNIHEQKWDSELCALLNIPMNMLPEVRPSAGIFGHTAEGLDLPAGIPIAGIAGDQQAALFGQACWQAGQAKNTYGTGCFLLMNMGQQHPVSDHGLLTTLCCDENGQPAYALEGSVFFAGSTIQWLRDQLGIIKGVAESEALAAQVQHNEGVYLVPAFAGLGAPYWDSNSRGAIMGLTRGSAQPQIARAALESIAYQTRDLVTAMSEDSGIKLAELRVDGGACSNDLLMQFQADILNAPVQRPGMLETTAIGSAWLAGLAVGFWSGPDELRKIATAEQRFEPRMAKDQRELLYAGWQEAVSRVASKASKDQPALHRESADMQIEHSNGHFPVSDGLNLFWQSWQAANPPRSIIILIHGLCEHSSRYAHVGKNLARAGHAVYACDLRGHGWSPDGKKPGRVHIDRFSDYIADVDGLFALASNRHPNAPVFILGHSMGGLISMSYALLRSPQLAGAIISSPAIAPNPAAPIPKMLLLLVSLLSKLAPRLRFGSELDSSKLSHDPAVVAAYDQDPLIGSKVSARWFAEVSSAMQALQLGAGDLEIPMLLMQSGKDILVDPEATRIWANAAPAEKMEYVPWPDFYHEMFNEPEKEDVLVRVQNWLDRQLAHQSLTI